MSTVVQTVVAGRSAGIDCRRGFDPIDRSISVDSRAVFSSLIHLNKSCRLDATYSVWTRDSYMPMMRRFIAPVCCTMKEASPNLRNILAENIRAIRAQQGLSQEQLAASCGLHRTYIGSVERAERNISLSSLECIARALGLTVPQLLTPKEERNAQ